MSLLDPAYNMIWILSLLSDDSLSDQGSPLMSSQFRMKDRNTLLMTNTRTSYQCTLKTPITAESATWCSVISPNSGDISWSTQVRKLLNVSIAERNFL
jgi:methionyl-tRNA formyltransferase